MSNNMPPPRIGIVFHFYALPVHLSDRLSKGVILGTFLVPILVLILRPILGAIFGIILASILDFFSTHFGAFLASKPAKKGGPTEIGRNRDFGGARKGSF